MPINHHVLIRLNPVASREIYLPAAVILELPRGTIQRAIDETDLNTSRNIIYFAILDKICALKDVVNTGRDTPIILEAIWSENEAPVAADRELAELHGVSHKIEMVMKDKSAVEEYFAHPEHKKLIDRFMELSKQHESIFLPGGFAVPFDTSRPSTPRTVKDIVGRTGAAPFSSEGAAREWALLFKGKSRDGDFSRDDDLRATAAIIAPISAPQAAEILAAITPAT